MAPRLPSLSYRQVDRLLRAHGFRPVHQVGSHVHYRTADGRRTVVPRHARDIGVGLLSAILKDAGIDPDEVRR